MDATATSPMIDVRNLTRVYRAGDVDIQALRGVTLTIARGEFVAIVGSSGSGKSTLMAILGCLDRPTSGEYFFEGVDVAGLTEPELARIRSARIGFVFQTFNLLARTTALENVSLPLFYAAAGPARRSERASRAHAALEMLGLGDRAGNTPAQLSGGQQQRVAIARALINDPSLLLADEPTGNVDTHASHEIMEQLVALNRDRQVTVVVVTHEPDIAGYADRVITVRDGEVVGDERRRPARPAPPLPAGTEIAAPVASRSGAPLAFAVMVLGAAMQALRRNVLRSSLTMLGVFIGVAALIAMVAVGQGANEAVKKQIESLGTNLLVIQPGASTASGVRGGLGSASTLTVADAQAIRRDDPAVAQISYLNRQMTQVQYADQNWTTQIQGVSPNYPAITNWQIAGGRGLSDDDDRQATLVAVIGETVHRQLFSPTENPVGATILVKRVPMRVVGVFVPKGQTPFGQDQDDLVMIPFSTAERKVIGVAAPSQTQASQTAIYEGAPNPFGLQPRLTGKVNAVFVQAVRPEDVTAAIDQVTATLARRHHIKPGDTNDFSVRNLSQIADVVQGSSRVMALLLATVASISLLVGGIGIMNILLVSVTERTREIGLRMAIGARRLHVLLQFLAEAVFLSVTGGVLGIVAGVVASRVISAVAGWPTAIASAAIAGGFSFSGAVGIFFGYYPARKASRLDPIEALRYE
ncbi:MAG TPA: ABC transporter permease [Vicinamibacterales bacterium]|nr:ABC transporter permease [Vicinamibacterales bacterium]